MQGAVFGAVALIVYTAPTTTMAMIAIEIIIFFIGFLFYYII